MAKSIIVYGVKGGKTRFAQRIADHFGLELAAYEFQREGNNFMWTYSKLYLSSDTDNPGGEYSPHSRSFQSVADEINAAIPLTDWQSGPPPMVGEWEIQEGRTLWRRWWDGECWSFAWEPCGIFSDYCNFKRDKNFHEPWRGLSAEPIKVTE